MTDGEICEINRIEHFQVIKTEQHENDQTSQVPDVKTKTCNSTHRQWKNKKQCKLVIHLERINYVKRIGTFFKHDVCLKFR